MLPTDSYDRPADYIGLHEVCQGRGRLGLGLDLGRASWTAQEPENEDDDIEVLIAEGLERVMENRRRARARLSPARDKVFPFGQEKHGLSEITEAKLSSGWAQDLFVRQSHSDFNINFPFRGLHKMLLSSPDKFYAELDRLEDSGFAVGLDILPRDMELLDMDDICQFTGTYSAKSYF